MKTINLVIRKKYGRIFIPSMETTYRLELNPKPQPEVLCLQFTKR